MVDQHSLTIYYTINIQYKSTKRVPEMCLVDNTYPIKREHKLQETNSVSCTRFPGRFPWLLIGYGIVIMHAYCDSRRTLVYFLNIAI